MNNDVSNLEAFIKQISDLKVEISRNSAGGLTVCSTSEPLFCYDVQNESEAAALVQDTIKSYGRLFFHVDLPSFRVRSEALDGQPLTVERGIPVSRVVPVFDEAA